MFSAVLILALSIVSIVAQDGDTDTNRIWTIAIGHDWGAHEYFDQSGYIRGFSPDLISAVCEAAGIECRTMWTPYKWCITSDPGLHTYGGQGLVDGWVDGCLGWSQTVGRIHIFNFSLPYTIPSSSYLFVKPGSTTDLQDLTGKKIVFVQGWSSDEKCLARQQSDERQNYILSEEQIVYVAGQEEMADAILNGEADAGFCGMTGMEAFVADGTLEFVQDFAAECALADSSMMTRKDSGLNAVWNVGFQIIQASGEFQQLCEGAQARHENRGTINCIGL